MSTTWIRRGRDLLNPDPLMWAVVADLVSARVFGRGLHVTDKLEPYSDGADMQQVSITWRNREIVYEGLRDGNVIAWLEPEPRPESAGGVLVQRQFLLLDPGIKLHLPNVWVERGDPIWYVDLVRWKQTGNQFDITDMDIDLFVPTDGRPYRTVDLDEFADAIEVGEFTLPQAFDAMRRWQVFLDRHIQRFDPSDVAAGWKDFPPNQITRLQQLADDAFPESTGN